MAERKTQTLTPAESHAAMLWMQIDAAGKRDQVAPQLVEMAAETWTRWQEAAGLVRERGVLIETKQGTIANPAAAIEKASCALYQQLLGRMGISATPSQSRYVAGKVTRLAPVDSVFDIVDRAPERVKRIS